MSGVKSLCGNSTISDFEVFYDRKLGKGGFGEVFVAKRKSSCEEVALKMINQRIIREKGMEKKVWDEVRIHANLKHPRIVEMFECFKDEKFIYIVLELCECDLDCYLKSTSDGVLSERDASNVLEQVVDGVLYLKKCNVIHRDLSAKNILLDKNMNVKICDFGLATQVKKNEKNFTVCGTPNYMAPEVALRESHGYEADVWSIGCLLFFMLVGRPPFGAGQASETLKRVVSQQVEIPDFLSREAGDLIRKLTMQDTNERMRLTDIRNHPFLKRRNISPYYSVSSSADSGRGTITTNASSLKTDNSHQSRNSDRRIHRRCSPLPPMRAFRADSELMPPPLPPAIMPPLCSIDPKHFDRRAASRSCEQRSTNIDGYCTHSRMNDDNSCAKCGRQSNTKNYCNHSQRAADSNCLKCGSADVSPSIVSHRTVASCGKCDSYRETGNCTGRCKYKPRSRSDLCSEEPCCSKDDNSAGTPGPTIINVPRDERGRTLNDIVQPIKSHRLKATRQETEKFVFTLLDDGDVCLEMIKLNHSHVPYVSEVSRISSDGNKIVIYHPNCGKGEKLSSQPQAFDWRTAEHYSFNDLPSKYFKLYLLASNIVNLLRGKTWKIKFCTVVGNCYLMENGNFEARFTNGKTVTKKKLRSGEWSSIECASGVELNCDEISFVDTALKKCLLVESRLESLENDIECCFPLIIFGRKIVSKSNSSFEANKENDPVSSMIVPKRSSTPHRPLIESTNVPKHVQQDLRRHHFEKYKCHFRKLNQRDTEFSYEAGDKLLFLDAGNKIEYISKSGKRYSFEDGKQLPPIVEKRMAEVTDMLRLIRNMEH